MIGPPLANFDAACRWLIGELASRRWLQTRRISVLSVVGAPRNICVEVQLETGELLSCQFESAVDIKPHDGAHGQLRQSFWAAIQAARAKDAPREPVGRPLVR